MNELPEQMEPLFTEMVGVMLTDTVEIAVLVQPATLAPVTV